MRVNDAPLSSILFFSHTIYAVESMEWSVGKNMQWNGTKAARVEVMNRWNGNK